MNEKPLCPGCGISIHIDDEEIAAIFGDMKVTAANLADEAQYKLRMDICNACGSLLFGTTCRHCGCIVKIKAKLAASRCPDPSGAKWEPVSGIRTPIKREKE